MILESVGEPDVDAIATTTCPAEPVLAPEAVAVLSVLELTEIPVMPVTLVPPIDTVTEKEPPAEPTFVIRLLSVNPYGMSTTSEPLATTWPSPNEKEQPPAATPRLVRAVAALPRSDRFDAAASREVSDGWTWSPLAYNDVDPADPVPFIGGAEL
jgi:hypothetical protein